MCGSGAEDQRQRIHMSRDAGSSPDTAQRLVRGRPTATGFTTNMPPRMPDGSAVVENCRHTERKSECRRETGAGGLRRRLGFDVTVRPVRDVILVTAGPSARPGAGGDFVVGTAGADTLGCGSTSPRTATGADAGESFDAELILRLAPTTIFLAKE